MVYDVHQKKDLISATTKSDGRSNHIKQCRVPPPDKEAIISHSNFFFVVNAHYCRAKTKKYLQADLNIDKICDLYKEECENQNVKISKSS